MSRRGDIQDALAARLASITTANGYPFTVKKVFYDDIPQGIDLTDSEIPSILMLDKECRTEHAYQVVDCQWLFELQLIHGEVKDTVMLDFVRQVLKAIYANSPTEQTTDAIRTIHPSVYDVQISGAFGDLHTIEANRFAILEIILFCRLRPWDF